MNQATIRRIAKEVGEHFEQEQAANNARKGAQQTMPEPTGKIWKLSEIKNLSDAEWREFKPAIRKAIAEGRIEVDVQEPFSNFRLDHYKPPDSKPNYKPLTR